jgi:hypothetical protein
MQWDSRSKLCGTDFLGVRFKRGCLKDMVIESLRVSDVAKRKQNKKPNEARQGESQ